MLVLWSDIQMHIMRLTIDYHRSTKSSRRARTHRTANCTEKSTFFFPLAAFFYNISKRERATKSAGAGERVRTSGGANARRQLDRWNIIKMFYWFAYRCFNTVDTLAETHEIDGRRRRYHYTLAYRVRNDEVLTTHNTNTNKNTHIHFTRITDL